MQFSLQQSQPRSCGVAEALQRLCRHFRKCPRTPMLASTAQSTSLSTVSNAFSKSTKQQYSFFPRDRHF